MQQATVDAIVQWGQRTFANREWVQKDEVIASAEASDLPASAKRALRELPQERFSRDELFDRLRHIRDPQTRLRMDQPPDGVPGGGHSGESEDTSI
jgi:hypothetical protein